MRKRPAYPRLLLPRSLLLPAAVAAFLCVQTTGTAWAETVGVRLGAHKEYTRVVVDFDRLVGYKVNTKGGNVTVTFDADATLSPNDQSAGLVSGMAADKADKTATLKLNIPEGARVKHYRLMRKIVVDVYPADASAAKAAEKPAPKETKKTDTKAADKAPAPETAKPAAAQSTAPVTAAAPASVPVVAPETPPATTSAPPETAAAVAPATSAADTQTVPANTAPAETPAAPPSPLAPATLGPIDPKVAAQLPQEVLVDAAPQPAEAPPAEPQRTTLRFSSIAPLQMAVFTRDSKLWIVSEGSTGSAQSPEAKGPLANMMGTPDVMRFTGGIAYRYQLPPETFVGVDKNNMTWEINLGPIPQQAPGREIVHVEFDNTSGEAKLLAALKGNGKLLTLQDPDAGDTLQVVTVSLPSERIDQGRRFSDVEVMPAFAGMVVRPLADGVRVTRINDYVLVTAADGIRATPDAGPVMLNNTGRASEGSDYARLFDFPSWRQGGIENLSRNRRALEQRAASAPNDDIRNEAIMNMALLYFANNFGQETLGVLRLLEMRNPALARNANFIALRGAAAAMAGHYQDALQDLSNPAIQQHPEVNLWIGYAAAATEQWRMANRSFPTDNSLLIEYPPNISTPFTIYMAESALRLGRTDTATKLLDTLDTWGSDMEAHHRAAIAYLKGEVSRQEGRKAEAIRIWRPVANGLDRLYHAKASLALANLELAEGNIKLNEAIDRIDSLRFAWRGDGLEVQIMHNLGLLKVQNGQYLDGLGDMKTAMALADTLLDDTDVIRADMSRVISDIFIGGQAQNISPLEAISIHTAYGNLLPTGTEGAAATLNFADFLIRVDLLEKAAELINSQLMAGTVPPEKVPALGAKLAAIYLLDSRPAEALSALQRSTRSDTDPKMEQERQMMRARALSQLNRTDEAIAAIATYDTGDAKRLRADVLWRARRWVPAAQTIESMLPATPPNPMPPETAEMVVNAAVAYKLGGDSAGLEGLRKRFGASINATPQANAFGVITRDGGQSALGDRETILKIAGEVDMFKGFLKSYQSLPDVKGSGG